VSEGSIERGGDRAASLLPANAIAAVFAAVALAAVAPPARADGRHPGSVLVFPTHRNGSGYFTLLAVTNSSLAPSTPVSVGGATAARFRYFNLLVESPDPQTPGEFEVFERVEQLTPGDTLAVLTACHDAGDATRGYVVVDAENPNGSGPWSHNALMGTEIVCTPMGAAFALGAVPFSSRQPDGSPTDVDGDARLDFDGVEYEGAPDVLDAPVFAAGARSSLVLVALTGGAAFETVARLSIWNDNEYPLSATLAFRWWIERPLADVSLAFTPAFLKQNTPNDPSELDLTCDGIGDTETGWFQVDGLVANSAAVSIPDPALLGALVPGPDAFVTVATLLHESAAKQCNGSFLSFATDGDGPGSTKSCP